jgi:hypothetical protein
MYKRLGGEVIQARKNEYELLAERERSIIVCCYYYYCMIEMMMMVAAEMRGYGCKERAWMMRTDLEREM